MKKTLVWCGLLNALLFLGGCETQEAAPDAQNASDGQPSHPELTDEEKAEIANTFAKLSPDDRALAEKQVICPVAGGPLGKMGVPPKVMVPTADGGERPVFICCEGCREELLAEPEKYLAKLPK